MSEEPLSIIRQKIIDSFNAGCEEVVINETTYPELEEFLEKHDLDEIVFWKDDESDIHAYITSSEFSTEEERDTAECRERTAEVVAELNFERYVEEYKDDTYY